ncbi:MAG: DUF2218 domain-containing protein [Novosphingobium sp.]
MTHSSTSIVPTTSASRYLQQLCKHWAHNMEVEFDAQHGRVVFPKNARGADWPGDGLFTMAAGDMALTCRIEATSEGQLEGLKGAVERHLNRFAFREGELAFTWQDD